MQRVQRFSLENSAVGKPSYPVNQQQREAAMAKKKRYEVRATCPNCACGTVSHMSAEEIRSKTIDGDKLEINCPECMELHRANIKSACPDYAEECHL